MTLLTELNECDSSPCLNGGTCFNAINAYICTCVAGFTDLECSSGNISLLLVILARFLSLFVIISAGSLHSFITQKNTYMIIVIINPLPGRVTFLSLSA